MDDVISAHKPRLLDVAAQLRCSLQGAALGLAINGAYEYTLRATNARGRAGTTRPQCMGVLNMHDIMFAYNVPAYVATRK